MFFMEFFWRISCALHARRLTPEGQAGGDQGRIGIWSAPAPRPLDPTSSLLSGGSGGSTSPLLGGSLRSIPQGLLDVQPLLQNGLTKIPSKHQWEASVDLNQQCWASKYTAPKVDFTSVDQRSPE